MRNIFFLIIFALLGFNCLYGQSTKDSIDGPKVYINNDVKLTTSQNGSQPATGTGSLGISFTKNYMYGSVSFNVINKNSKLSTPDSSEVKLFANNLLIPENSGQGISSFYISLGFKSFYRFDKINPKDSLGNPKPNKIKFISLKRIGVFAFWQANNTTWTKDSVSTSILINSPGIYFTYSLFNWKLLNETHDQVSLSAFLGYQTRHLGGDYGLAGNEKIRQHFLEMKKDKVDFICTSFGFRFELGSFFGKIQETYTWGKYDIPGFSGWQAIVTIGANVKINIPVERVFPL